MAHRRPAGYAVPHPGARPARHASRWTKA
jgi:hypothetical protein